MTEIDTTRKKEYFTEDGKNALKTRLKHLIEIYNGEELRFKYGASHRTFGFGDLFIQNKEELHSRILELCAILQIGLEREKRIQLHEDKLEEINSKLKLAGDHL